MTKLSQLIISVCTLFTLSCSTSTNNDMSNKDSNFNDKTIDSLHALAKNHFKQGDFDKSETVFSKAESLITPSTDSLITGYLINDRTELLKRKGEYEVCLINYFKVLKISKSIKDYYLLGLSYYNLASTYYFLDQLTEAERYSLKAKEIFSIEQEDLKIANCFTQLSSIKRKQGNMEMAKEYLDKALSIYEVENELHHLSIGYNNYANLLYSQGDYSKAIFFYQKAIHVNQHNNNNYSMAIRLGNIGESYLQIGQLDHAKKYIDSSLKLAEKIDSKETIVLNYERLVDYYKQNKNWKKSLEDSEKLTNLKTDLMRLESSQLINKKEDELKNELALQETKHKLNISEKNKAIAEKDKRTNFLFFSILITILLSVIALVSMHLKKQKRLRQVEKKLSDQERNFLKNKNQRFKRELDQKQNELILFSIKLKERIQYQTDLKTNFKKLESNQEQLTTDFMNLKVLIYSQDESLSLEMQNKIDALGNEFYKRIKKLHPNLSESEIRLSSLLFIGLSSKEIAQILQIESKSVDMKRYRLKKKIGLDQDKKLTDYLRKIN